MKIKNWLVYVIVHVVFLGVWGALIEIPEKQGFPATLGYVVWSFTMIPMALVALNNIDWKFERDPRSIFLGSLTGILGAAGQLVLFIALEKVPAYIAFPILSLTPVITILMAIILLGERTNKLGGIGVILAVISILLMSYQSPSGEIEQNGYQWLVLVLIPLFFWGIQGYVMKFANKTMRAESIFLYMTLSSLLFIPVGMGMTNFDEDINWGGSGMVLALGVHVLNAIGILCLVYAFRYGKAIIIAPMTTALSPVLTAVISMAIYTTIPSSIVLIGIFLAIISAVAMCLAEIRMSSRIASGHNVG